MESEEEKQTDRQTEVERVSKSVSWCFTPSQRVRLYPGEGGERGETDREERSTERERHEADRQAKIERAEKAADRETDRERQTDRQTVKDRQTKVQTDRHSPQSCSSEPSPQSLSPSQRNSLVMHLLLPQWNWCSPEQSVAATTSPCGLTQCQRS